MESVAKPCQRYSTDYDDSLMLLGDLLSKPLNFCICQRDVGLFKSGISVATKFLRYWINGLQLQNVERKL